MTVVTPVSTTKFRDSIGIVTHLHYFSPDCRYIEWEKVVAILKDIGIYRVRDGGHWSTNAGWNAEVDRRTQLAGNAGIRFNMALGANTNQADTKRRLDQMVAAYAPKGWIYALEGPNEYDNAGSDKWQPGSTSWHDDLRKWMAFAFPLVRSKPALNGIPVVGPSLVHGTSPALLGDVSALMDRQNWHPYAGGMPPRRSHIESERAKYVAAFKGDLAYATECGYHTTPKYPPGGHSPTSEKAQAPYIIRTHLEHYTAGIQHTSTYELLDEFAPGAGTDPECFFGLIRNDWTWKPAAHAMKAFIGMLGPTGPTTIKPFDLAVHNPAVKSLPLQRTDGSYIVVLWTEASVWDRDKRVDLNPPLTLTDVALPQAKKVEYAIPTGPTTWQPMKLEWCKVTAGVAGNPVVLRITT